MHAYICSVVRSIGRHRPDGLGTRRKKKKKTKGLGDFGERVIGLGDLLREGKGGGGLKRGGGRRGVMLC